MPKCQEFNAKNSIRTWRQKPERILTVKDIKNLNGQSLKNLTVPLYIKEVFT